MIIDIPGYKKLQITTLLLDYNGTIAEDGVIRPAVRERLQKLSKDISGWERDGCEAGGA